MSYFPLFFDMKGRSVLVVGAGTVALRRIKALSEAGAEIRVVAKEVSERAESLFKTLSESENGVISLYRMDYRDYRKHYRPGGFLVLTATGDPEADRLAEEDGRRAGAFVNVAGVKEKSDFYFPGIAKHGPVVAGITAGGGDHLLAKHMTQAVQRCLAEADREK